MKTDDKYSYQENLQVFRNRERQMSTTFPAYIPYDSQSNPSLLARTKHPLCPCSPIPNLSAPSDPFSLLHPQTHLFYLPCPLSPLGYFFLTASSPRTSQGQSVTHSSPELFKRTSPVPSQAPLTSISFHSQSPPTALLSQVIILPHSPHKTSSSPSICTSLLGSHFQTHS